MDKGMELIRVIESINWTDYNELRNIIKTLKIKSNIIIEQFHNDNTEERNQKLLKDKTMIDVTRALIKNNY